MLFIHEIYRPIHIVPNVFVLAKQGGISDHIRSEQTPSSSFIRAVRSEEE